MTGGAGNAQAQTLTTQMLIGDAVSTDSLAKYTDVDQAIKYFINRDVLAARQALPEPEGGGDQPEGVEDVELEDALHPRAPPHHVEGGAARLVRAGRG